ncbi:MAG: hypothetical protein EOP34_03010 [Rickettsiales bacterium]|nr:MAG: hypothetical protein EOP34_03010 [Rickettsiales bacterium]
MSQIRIYWKDFLLIEPISKNHDILPEFFQKQESEDEITYLSRFTNICLNIIKSNEDIQLKTTFNWQIDDNNIVYSSCSIYWHILATYHQSGVKFWNKAVSYLNEKNNSDALKNFSVARNIFFEIYTNILPKWQSFNRKLYNSNTSTYEYPWFVRYDTWKILHDATKTMQVIAIVKKTLQTTTLNGFKDNQEKNCDNTFSLVKKFLNIDEKIHLPIKFISAANKEVISNFTKILLDYFVLEYTRLITDIDIYKHDDNKFQKCKDNHSIRASVLQYMSGCNNIMDDAGDIASHSRLCAGNNLMFGIPKIEIYKNIHVVFDKLKHTKFEPTYTDYIHSVRII